MAIHPSAIVDASVHVPESCTIGPFCVVGPQVEMGEHCELISHVVLSGCHYYDVAMLAQGPIRADALADKDLLTQVVRHKETFYPSAWARYDLARPGSFRLSPVENRVAALERDYRNMTVMIFGDAPKFDWIMETVKALEQEINR